MNLAFINVWQPLRANTPDTQPLGGTESAVCYLSQELVRRGHQVTIYSKVSTSSIDHHVHAQPVSSLTKKTLSQHQFIILQNEAKGIIRYRPLIPQGKLIFWTQMHVDQPFCLPLKYKSVCDQVDQFVFVSLWSQNQYHNHFPIDATKSTTIGNAIAPTFEALPQTQTANKPPPITLVYTSQANRGLDILLKVFPHIFQVHSDVRLKVYSSLQTYGKSKDDDQKHYGHLYHKCLKLNGADYVGGIPQTKLAQELSRSHIFAYPNTYKETSCISLLEALASGNLAVTSNYGALSETAGGHADLVDDPNSPTYQKRFTTALLELINTWEQKPTLAQLIAQNNRRYVFSQFIWAHRAKQWVALFHQLSETL